MQINQICVDNNQQGMEDSRSVQITCQQVNGFSNEIDNDEKRKVYDNIHGFIYFPKLIWDFIDTPHFQRLRRIKQLGCLEYVFPGATHTRFEHCLGTAYLARKYIEVLIENNPKSYPKEVRQSAKLTITLAGLLHDIGHGPYSHTFDSYIVTQIHKKGESEPIKWTHEIASEVLFQHMVTSYGLGKHLTQTQVKRVRALISGEPQGERQWQFQIISNKINGIDVDKLDYFRRDAFYMGAKNIYVDHDLLMNQARIIGNQICYPTKYVQMVYNIFHCRYKLYKNYYFNVVSKGIQLMICDILKEIRSKFKFQQICGQIYTDPRRYIKLTDNILQKVQDIYDNIISDPNSPDAPFVKNFERAVDILKRIKIRQIYKFVKEFHYFIREVSDERIMELFKKSFDKATIIDNISKQSKIDKDLICLSISDIGFGLKEANPLKKVGFFRKQLNSLKKLHPSEIENLSMLYTNAYIERSIKIFVKVDNSTVFTKVENSFTNYCKNFNNECQLISGLNVIFQGRGGRTPLPSSQENTYSQTAVSDNPFQGLPQQQN